MANINDFFKNPDAKEDTILFIDMMNLCHRCIYVAGSKGKKEYMTQTEMYTYWKYMVINNIINSVKTYSPSRVVIALDAQDNWRKKIYPDYKGHRKALRDNNAIIDFNTFFPIMKEFIETFKNAFSNFIFLEVPNSEGDDVIAVLIKNIGNKYNTCICISNDGDYKQLLKYDNVKVFNPIEKKFVKSLNVKNDLLCKILQGDTSDNIKAVAPRVGPATAMSILKEGLDTYLESDKTIKENYIRNKTLIDWDYIPEDISNSILEAYNSIVPSNLNSNKLMQFFASLRIPKLTETYTTYSKFLAKCK